tara:strand:- start:51 stop:881 length:831 start_codon:yes stop_codon:yes gene_type:complete
MFIVKCLNLIPRPIQKVIGYSSFGTYFLKRIKRSNSKIPFSIDNDIKINLELSNPLTWDLILGKDLEQNVKEKFIESVKPGDTVVDIGAHIGEYTLLGAKLVNSSGKVISIEPLHDTADSLRENIILNNFSNCMVLENAVGSVVSKQTLYKVSEEDVYGYLDPVVNNKKLIKTDEIDVTTVDQIIKSNNLEKIDLLKIDVEGFEYDVLLGCKSAFEQDKIKKIICEIHSDFLKAKNFDEEQIYTLLKSSGFEITKIQEIINKQTTNIFASKISHHN